MGQYLSGVDPRNNPNNTVGFINETCVIKYNNCNIFQISSIIVSINIHHNIMAYSVASSSTTVSLRVGRAREIFFKTDYFSTKYLLHRIH